MIRNSRNRRKPISKARLSSTVLKAGTSTRSEISLRLGRFSFLGHVDEKLEIASR